MKSESVTSQPPLETKETAKKTTTTNWEVAEKGQSSGEVKAKHEMKKDDDIHCRPTFSQN